MSHTIDLYGTNVPYNRPPWDKCPIHLRSIGHLRKTYSKETLYFCHRTPSHFESLVFARDSFVSVLATYRSAVITFTRGGNAHCIVTSKQKYFFSVRLLFYVSTMAQKKKIKIDQSQRKLSFLPLKTLFIRIYI